MNMKQLVVAFFALVLQVCSADSRYCTANGHKYSNDEIVVMSNYMKHYSADAYTDGCDIDHAMRYLADKLRNYCKMGAEASYGLYEFEDPQGNIIHYLGDLKTYAYTDPERAKTQAPGFHPGQDDTYGISAKLVAVVHNHPKQDGFVGATWPSVADAKNSIILNLPSYILDCNGGVLKFDQKNGRVGRIDANGDWRKINKNESSYSETYFGIDDGKVYDPERFVELLQRVKNEGRVVVGSSNDDLLDYNQVSSDNVNAELQNTARASKRNAARDSVDTSKAESLFEKRISFLESLLAKGEHVTMDQCSQYNSYSNDGAAEMARLLKEIDAFPVSDAEKASIAKKSFSKMNALAKKVADLESRAEAGNLGNFRASNEPPPKDASTCPCSSPSLSYIKCSDNIPAVVKCLKCKRVVGTLFHKRLTSSNPAVNGKLLK